MGWDVVYRTAFVEDGRQDVGLFVILFPMVISKPIRAWCCIGGLKEVPLDFGRCEGSVIYVTPAVEGVKEVIERKRLCWREKVLSQLFTWDLAPG